MNDSTSCYFIDCRAYVILSDGRGEKNAVYHQIQKSLDQDGKYLNIS